MAREGAARKPQRHTTATGDGLHDEYRAALHASLDRAAADSDAGRKMEAWEHLKQCRARGREARAGG